jgi:predicted RNA-binding Zn-ribbon protein involved in translation (DUF1610 family)
MDNPQRRLRILKDPGNGPIIHAPPVIAYESHTIDFLCGACGTVLMHAHHNQPLHHALIHCTECGAINATDA